MRNTDMDWVREQLTEAKTKRAVGDAVLLLLEVWEKIKQTSVDNDKDITEKFGKLALGYALVEPTVDGLEGTWVQAMPGQMKVTDVVRVKSDAFDGDLGRMHNGRVGKIVGVRYGDIIVNSIDKKQPSLDGSHYSPHMLEILVR